MQDLQNLLGRDLKGMRDMMPEELLSSLRAKKLEVRNNVTRPRGHSEDLNESLSRTITAVHLAFSVIHQRITIIIIYLVPDVLLSMLALDKVQYNLTPTIPLPTGSSNNNPLLTS